MALQTEARPGRQNFTNGAAGNGVSYTSDNFAPVLFVDTVAGQDYSSGFTPANPLATMTAAFALLAQWQAAVAKSADNAVIEWIGDIREQLVAPLGVSGVTIRARQGGMNRHDNGTRWRVPATTVAGQALLELREQGWVIDGGLFVPDTTGGAAIKAHRNEDATYPDSSHFIVRNARFVGGGGTPIGIQDVGGNFDYLIEDCIFQSLTSAITCTSTAIAIPLSDTIRRNRFVGCTNDITSSYATSVLHQNKHMTAGSGGTNKVVQTNFNSSQGSNNHVTLNEFTNTSAQIKNNAGFNGATGDTWSNYATSTAALIVESPPAAS